MKSTRRERQRKSCHSDQHLVSSNWISLRQSYAEQEANTSNIAMFLMGSTELKQGQVLVGPLFSEPMRVEAPLTPSRRSIASTLRSPALIGTGCVATKRGTV
jgi:hypothetical protein